MHFQMKFKNAIYFAVVLFFSVVLTEIREPAENTSDQFKSVYQYLKGIGGQAPVDYSRLLSGRCSVLLENDGELLEIMLDLSGTTALEHVVTVVCQENFEVFKMALNVAAKAKDSDILQVIYNDIMYLKSKPPQKYYQAFFSTCIETQRHDGIKLLKDRLCRIVDEKGRNMLHLAAIMDDEKLFNTVDHCKLLINQKDHEGIYPMEYVKSAELALRFNLKWLEVAKERFLSLNTISQRTNLCANFNLGCVNEPNERPARGRVFKEAFEAGIEDAENFYCPYFKMKLDLVTMRGKDPSGLILEWLSFLLNDIFGTGTSENTDNFEAALFRFLPDENEWIPTMKYNAKVYEFAGKIMSIANQFGLAIGHEFKQNTSQHYRAFCRGRDALKFHRIEVHQVGRSLQSILRGNNLFVPLWKSYEELLYKLGSYNRHFERIKVFRNLSDREQLTLLQNEVL